MRPRPTDYQYYEDAADAEREDGAGTLLPLWKFEFSLPGPLEVLLSKALLIYSVYCVVQVTGMAWSPQYSDLFAVSLGSCEPHTALTAYTALHSTLFS